MTKIDDLKKAIPELRQYSDGEIADVLFERRKNKNLSREEYNRKIGYFGDDAGDTGGNVARAVAQGLTFGFGDEIEAGARSLFGSGGYRENAAKIRNQMDEFRQQNPLAAYGAEIGGAILPSIFTGGAGAGLTASRLGAKAGQTLLNRPSIRGAIGGALSGAISGAGTSEGSLLDRAQGAGLGSAFGGVAGAGAGLLPFLKPGVAKAIDRGEVKTLGKGMLIGNLAIPEMVETQLKKGIAGGLIKGRQAAGEEVFRRKQMNFALEKIGQKIPKEIETTQEALEFSANAFRRAYDDIYDEMELKDAPGFFKSVEAIADELVGDTRDVVLKAVERGYRKGTLDEFLTGKGTVKNIKDELDNQKSKLLGDQLIGSANVVNDMIELLKTYATSGNKTILERFNRIQRGYRELVPIEKAAAKASAQGSRYRGGQLSSAIRQTDQSVRKRQTIQGRSPMQDFAERQTRYYGNPADSGTPSGSELLLGMINPLALAGSLGTAVTYGIPGGVRVARQTLLAPGRIGRGSAGYIGGLLGSQSSAGE